MHNLECANTEIIPNIFTILPHINSKLGIDIQILKHSFTGSNKVLLIGLDKNLTKTVKGYIEQVPIKLGGA